MSFWSKKLKSDSGSAPAATLAWVGVFMLLLYGILSFITAASAHSQLQAAADFSALAAADSLAANLATGSGANSSPAPCQLAAQIAQSNNGAALEKCEIVGMHVRVELSGKFTLPLSSTLLLKATAKAGPAPSAP